MLGTVLAAAVTARATGALARIPGITADLAGRLEGELAPSAGGVITQIRHGAIQVPHADAAAAALADAFADATRLTLIAGAVVLAVGFLATLALHRRRRGAGPSLQPVTEERMDAESSPTAL